MDTSVKEKSTEFLGVMIAPTLKRKLKTLADKEQRPVGSLVRRILTDYVNQAK